MFNGHDNIFNFPLPCFFLRLRYIYLWFIICSHTQIWFQVFLPNIHNFQTDLSDPYIELQRYDHSRSDWTWMEWQWRATSYSSGLQNLNLNNKRSLVSSSGDLLFLGGGGGLSFRVCSCIFKVPLIGWLTFQLNSIWNTFFCDHPRFDDCF